LDVVALKCRRREPEKRGDGLLEIVLHRQYIRAQRLSGGKLSREASNNASAISLGLCAMEPNYARVLIDNQPPLCDLEEMVKESWNVIGLI